MREAVLRFHKDARRLLGAQGIVTERIAKQNEGLLRLDAVPVRGRSEERRGACWLVGQTKRLSFEQRGASALDRRERMPSDGLERSNGSGILARQNACARLG